MRTIDADEFKKLLLKERDSIPKLIFDRYDFGVGRRNHDGDLIRAGIRMALRCMEQTPTIEAELVKHGRWVDHMVRDWRCSECGDKIHKVRNVDGYCYDDKPNYCPNCGALMDLEDTK